jgi:carboxypeptidase T
MRLHRRGRRTATLATLLALALAAPITATATHATATGAKAPAPSADDIRQYEIHQSTTPVTRTAIQQTGVTVDEADEETVVVSGRADQVKELRRLGYETSHSDVISGRKRSGTA